jgi:hypothetical protein
LKSVTFAENIIFGKWGCVGKSKHAIGTGAGSQAFVLFIGVSLF